MSRAEFSPSPESFAALGVMHARELPSGEWAGVARFMYTHGLLVGVDATGYRTRFCYPTFAAAFNALLTWDGRGDPPGPWIKEKGANDRPNPRHLAGIPIVTETVHSAKGNAS